MEEKNLFEIPIYRSNGKDIEKKHAEFIKMRKLTEKFTGIKRECQTVFQSKRFNDIVGWIVISIWLGRIRAEYWFVEQRVVIGLRNKTFDNRGKLFVYKFDHKVKDSNVIYNELSSLLKRSASEIFPKREIDYECFDSIGPYINWKLLTEKYSSNNLPR